MSLEFYDTASVYTCILPDVGIDKSLLKYSGMNSSAVLEAYSDKLVDSVPGFIESLGSSLGALNSIPNAVGLGAFLISMIMEVCIKGSTQTSDESSGLLKRVFGEEKASAVRDTMSEYLKRHHTFLNNEQRLQEEIRRLEAQLSGHLTTLRNSLLYDRQMSSRGFKIWVNGASFHLLMIIHEARLNVQAGKRESDYVDSIKVTIGWYLRDLENLLEKYKTYLTSITSIYIIRCYSPECAIVISPSCDLKNNEATCRIGIRSQSGCSDSEVIEGYIKNVFSRYEPITSLRNHFSNMKNNINSLINQHDPFTLPSLT
ncbi:uncharacterized protein LOC121891817 [Thunnus maccoyii]|uniref:uncharacterized protein LOC121891817 n=1 Tax=Thunnus maccoyii TaxID=8240 RepID=UPI001C4C699D|nr:uncharacterized protein LOC121891817 [Thunnus maccoyii]